MKRGVKLYRKAVEDDAENKFVLRAIGVLRATEHLSMAGLYAARDEAQTEGDLAHAGVADKGYCRDGPRLEQIEHKERGKGTDLFPVTVELVRQAEDCGS